MGFMNQMFGTAPKIKQVDTVSGQQKGYINDMLSQSQAAMQNPYAGFAPIAQQMMSQYQQSIPGILNRYGYGDNMGSSGLNAALAGGQRSLYENLGAMQANYGMQNRQQAMQMGQMGLTPTFQNMQTSGSQGLFGQLAGPLMGMGLSAATGGMLGAGMLGRTLMDQYKGGYGQGSYMPYSFLGGQPSDPRYMLGGGRGY